MGKAIHLDSIPQFLMQIKEYSLAMEVMGSHMDKELKRMQGLHITPNGNSYTNTDKQLFNYDGTRSYKGFMIDAVILVDREEIIIRWFEAVQ